MCVFTCSMHAQGCFNWSHKVLLAWRDERIGIPPTNLFDVIIAKYLAQNMQDVGRLNLTLGWAF